MTLIEIIEIISKICHCKVLFKECFVEFKFNYNSKTKKKVKGKMKNNKRITARKCNNGKRKSDNLEEFDFYSSFSFFNSKKSNF